MRLVTEQTEPISDEKPNRAVIKQVRFLETEPNRTVATLQDGHKGPRGPYNSKIFQARRVLGAAHGKPNPPTRAGYSGFLKGKA